MKSDFETARRFIERFDRFIITAHESPDGDAIGAEFALFRVLMSLGKRAMVLNSDPTPYKFEFIDTDHVIRHLTESTVLPADISEWALIILDTNDVFNTGLVSRRVMPEVSAHLILDHHESGKSMDPTNAIVDSDASSTCEILYELFETLGAKVDFAAAQALYAGITYDTGSFIYPKTTAKTFEIARVLVELGVNPNTVYGHVYESNSISSLLLQSRIFSTVELFFGDRVAVQYMNKQMIVECGAAYDEADPVINFPLRSERVRVSVFFKENLQGVLRCSLRSKGNIDVSEIAQAFEGGGHKTAAGFKCKHPLEQMRAKVLDMLQVYFD